MLACGFLAAAALGLWGVLLGDPVGYAYLVAAVVGYFFVRTRLVPATLWLLVAAIGAFAALTGSPPAWIESGLGLVLAVVAMLPPPSGRQSEFAQTATQLAAGQVDNNGLLAPNGDSSAFLEDSPTRSSGKVEVGSALDSAPAGDSALANRLGIRSIGNLQVIGSGGDLAPDLEDKPILAFIWKYLLCRAALGNPQVPREALADEASPGISSATQLVRLRKQIYHLTKDIRPELAALVQINRTHVWLNLTGVDFDVRSLRELATRVRPRGQLLDRELAEETAAMLQATGPQEFLAGFEELEHKVNRGRGDAGQLVTQVRALVGGWRADLARALAEYQDASGHLHAAIPHLEVALEAKPERQDLARLLVAAYMQSGQTKRAAEVRQAFDLNQE